MVLNSSMNILFYCIFNKQFRTQAKRVFITDCKWPMLKAVGLKAGSGNGEQGRQGQPVRPAVTKRLTQVMEENEVHISTLTLQAPLSKIQLPLPTRSWRFCWHVVVQKMTWSFFSTMDDGLDSLSSSFFLSFCVSVFAQRSKVIIDLCVFYFTGTNDGSGESQSQSSTKARSELPLVTWLIYVRVCRSSLDWFLMSIVLIAIIVQQLLPRHALSGNADPTLLAPPSL